MSTDPKGPSLYMAITSDYDSLGRASFTLFWLDESELPRGQCFHAVPEKLIEKGAVLCETEAEAEALAWRIEPARCVGDHFFEEICNACGAAKPNGSCSVCPHIGPREVCSAEHFARRPCLACGSSNLRSVRVKAPLR